jgi:hypothetical protein
MATPLVKKAHSLANLVHRWVDYEPKHFLRDKIAKIGLGARRKEALDSVAKKTSTRMNNGQREFLLHRSFGDSESSYLKGLHTYDNVGANRNIGRRKFKAWTSWSTKPHDPEDMSDRTHLISAWVPESHITSYLPTATKGINWNDHFAFRKLSNKVNLGPNGIGEVIKWDQEVIVHPGKFSILHHSEPKPKFHYVAFDLRGHMNDVSKKLKQQGIEAKKVKFY